MFNVLSLLLKNPSGILTKGVSKVLERDISSSKVKLDKLSGKPPKILVPCRDIFFKLLEKPISIGKLPINSQNLMSITIILLRS
jgi:hypothetical protein